MYALVSLVVIIALSMLVVRVGTLALEMTGMSRDVASFQALSAFSGAGYTTNESEEAVTYPSRRRVVQTLIRLGNVGVITSIASLVLSFVNAPTRLDRVLLILASAAVLVVLSRSGWFNRAVNPVIRRALRRTGSVEIRDYTSLLRLQDDYRIADFTVEAGTWLAGETLADLRLRSHEGVVVLGIRRDDDTYVGAPAGDHELRPGDTVVAYGKEDRLRELAERSAGDVAAHEEAKAAHHRTLARQRRLDPDADGA